MVNHEEFRLGNLIVNGTNGISVVTKRWLSAISIWGETSYSNVNYHPEMERFLSLPSSCEIKCGAVTTKGKILMFRHGKHFASCDYFHQMQNAFEDEYGNELKVDFNGIIGFINHTNENDEDV
jgi:hypothetical protein